MAIFDALLIRSLNPFDKPERHVSWVLPKQGVPADLLGKPSNSDSSHIVLDCAVAQRAFEAPLRVVPTGPNHIQEVRMSERRFDVRSELLGSLLNKVDNDPYPSITMLDMIEELLTPDDVPRYAQVLLSKVKDEQFPSISMLARIRDLA